MSLESSTYAGTVDLAHSLSATYGDREPIDGQVVITCRRRDLSTIVSLIALISSDDRMRSYSLSATSRLSLRRGQVTKIVIKFDADVGVLKNLLKCLEPYQLGA